MLSQYAQLSSSILARLFGSMHAFLVGLEALIKSIFCLSLHLPSFFVCAGTQQLILGVCEQ